MSHFSNRTLLLSLCGHSVTCELHREISAPNRKITFSITIMVIDLGVSFLLPGQWQRPLKGHARPGGGGLPHRQGTHRGPGSTSGPLPQSGQPCRWHPSHRHQHPDGHHPPAHHGPHQSAPLFAPNLGAGGVSASRGVSTSSLFYSRSSTLQVSEHKTAQEQLETDNFKSSQRTLVLNIEKAVYSLNYMWDTHLNIK